MPSSPVDFQLWRSWNALETCSMVNGLFSIWLHCLLTFFDMEFLTSCRFSVLLSKKSAVAFMTFAGLVSSKLPWMYSKRFYKVITTMMRCLDLCSKLIRNYFINSPTPFYNFLVLTPWWCSVSCPMSFMKSSILRFQGNILSSPLRWLLLCRAISVIYLPVSTSKIGLSTILKCKDNFVTIRDKQ